MHSFLNPFLKQPWSLNFVAAAFSPEQASDWTGAGMEKIAVEETHRPFPGMRQDVATQVFSPLYHAGHSFCQPCKIWERGGIGGPWLPPACGLGFVCLMLFLSSEDAALFKSLNPFPPATQEARDWAGEERWPHLLSSFALILASPGEKGI